MSSSRTPQVDVDPKRKTSSSEQPRAGTLKSGLEVFEQDSSRRHPWILNRTELKLLGIAGVGFFLDGELVHSLWLEPVLILSFNVAYDLFIINVCRTTMSFL